MNLVTREIKDAVKDSQRLTFVVEINNLRQTGVFSISWSSFNHLGV